MTPIRMLLSAAAFASTLAACATPDRGSIPAEGAARPGGTGSVETLEARPWTLVALDGKEVAAEVRPALRFEKGRVSGFSGINRISGTYRIEGDALAFGPIASTKMAGDPALMELEGAFANALGRVDAFRVAGNELALSSRGSVVAKFRSAP